VSDLTISNAVIFDGMAADLTEASVHIVDGAFAAEPGPGARVLDARGRVVVPGLIDAHFHAYGVALDLLEIEASQLSYLALSGARRLARALRRGFTTVRDVAGGDAGLAKSIARGLIESPRYLYTGAALSQTGGHGDARPVDLDVCACGTAMVEVVDGVDAVRRAVRDRFRRGAHAIKVMTSGGVMSPTDPIRTPQYSADELQVISAEALRRGSYVAAHAYSPEAIRHSVENGIRSIEHGNLLNAETAQLMATHDAFLVPTLATYDAMRRRGEQLGLAPVSRAKNTEVLDAGQQAIELAGRAGVRIGFGTDLMGDLEDEQLLGLRLQAEVAGVLDTLRSATSVNAALIGRPDLGRIGPGAVGDLVILGGNPFEQEPLIWEGARTVIQAGRIVADMPPLA
jgi:imidazolonepropionase-like amidohydrolase